MGILEVKKFSNFKNKKKLTMSRKTFVILSVLALISFFLRSYLLSDNLFFGPEQGRDMLVIKDIVVNHKLTLIGSKTDIDGVFHGPIFYYLAVIPFFLSHGDPYYTALFFIFIQSITVYLVFLVTYELMQKRQPAYIAAIIYTFSFASVVYARWFSNPPLSIPFSLLFFLSVLRFLRGDVRYLFGIGIAYAFLGQAEFINYLFFAGIGLLLIIRYRSYLRKIPLMTLCFAAGFTLFLSIGNYVLFDVRHDFLITHNVLKLILGGGNTTSFIDSGRVVFETFTNQIAYSIGLFSGGWGILLFSMIMFSLFSMRRKYKYLDIMMYWLIVPVLILIMLRHNVLVQLFVGSIAGYCIGIALVVYWFIEKNRNIGVFVFICFITLTSYTYMLYIEKNSNMFFQSTQPELRYKDQKNVVEYVYNESNGRPFFFQAYTIPYFWQDAWKYLFWYKGMKNKRTMPDEKYDDLLYVIIQKDRSNPRFQEDWYKGTVSSWGAIQSTKTFGELTVEERIK